MSELSNAAYGVGLCGILVYVTSRLWPIMADDVPASGKNKVAHRRFLPGR
jgi:hypothetical protein